MEESSKRLNLNIEQSASLLKLCLNPKQVGAKKAVEKNRADILLDTLALKLPVDPALLESLPAALRSLSEQLQSVSGLPLRKLLQDSKTRTTSIRKIKDFAKELGSSANDQIERDVALAIYFAAIASALLFRSVKISEYSYKELEQSFDALTGHDWVPPDLSRLFKKARKYCSNKG